MSKPLCLLFLLFLSLAGCHAHRGEADLSQHIRVFGVELYSDVDYREINGVKAVEEPCLRGFERNFEQLDIVIGYGFNGKIRKIFTRNRATGIFGIEPGIMADEAGRLARQAGFIEESPHRYRSGALRLTLLVGDTDRLFGVTIETDN